MFGVDLKTRSRPPVLSEMCFTGNKRKKETHINLRVTKTTQISILDRYSADPSPSQLLRFMNLLLLKYLKTSSPSLRIIHTKFGGQRSDSCSVSHQKPASLLNRRLRRTLTSESGPRDRLRPSLTSAAAAPLIHRSGLIGSDRSDTNWSTESCCSSRFLSSSLRDSNSANCC